MARSWQWIGSMAIWLTAILVVSRGPVLARQGGWILPPTAAAEKTPLTVTEATVAAGHTVFTSKCVRCHGPEGKGDGPDANPQHRHDMDLTKADDAADNPDGVVFYKVWNGRSSPRMPAFSDSLNKEQAWSVVAFVQTLRPKH